MIGSDPVLMLLAELVDARAELDSQIRSLTCLCREWATPPLSLNALGKVLRLSPGGVRVSYSDDIRQHVAELLGSKPGTARDPERGVWRPGAVPPGCYLLGLDAAGDPVTIPSGTGIAIVAESGKRETQILTKLLTHQIVVSEFPNLLSENVLADRLTPSLIERINALVGTPGEMLYGPVDDKFTHRGASVSLTEVLPTFTESDDIAIANIVAIASAPPPRHSILVGSALSAVVDEWRGKIPIITGPSRGHDWRWELTQPGNSERTVFRPAVPETTWAQHLLADIQAVQLEHGPTADSLQSLRLWLQDRLV